MSITETKRKFILRGLTDPAAEVPAEYRVVQRDAPPAVVYLVRLGPLRLERLPHGRQVVVPALLLDVDHVHFCCCFFDNGSAQVQTGEMGVVPICARKASRPTQSLSRQEILTVGVDLVLEDYVHRAHQEVDVPHGAVDPPLVLDEDPVGLYDHVDVERVRLGPRPARIGGSRYDLVGHRAGQRDVLGLGIVRFGLRHCPGVPAPLFAIGPLVLRRLLLVMVAMTVLVAVLVTVPVVILVGHVARPPPPLPRLLPARRAPHPYPPMCPVARDDAAPAVPLPPHAGHAARRPVDGQYRQASAAVLGRVGREEGGAPGRPRGVDGARREGVRGPVRHGRARHVPQQERGRTAVPVVPVGLDGVPPRPAGGPLPPLPGRVRHRLGEPPVQRDVYHIRRSVARPPAVRGRGRRRGAYE
ncbi:hypothetical protein THAOC_10954 [Thalassiosira oceanica]|uniref:Uncharacterized protein n=1 Tax=Thalassiosira oceanica TaxID=159749 RepID=K0SRA5_THAOC|nr:hypothetical protein THAOC_10954 [Thalassiosira oceanica]|eukprot:EJK67935.1 hypothetical protein THAOC_10954 [Thalassiosira oceanica]